MKKLLLLTILLIHYSSAQTALSDLPMRHISAATLALTIGKVKLGDEVKDHDPIPRWKPEPDYTKDARKQHICGLMGLSIDIDANGKPANIRVTRSLGYSLDTEAVLTVERWVFWPAIKDGVAVKAKNINVDFTFRLPSGCK